MKLARFVSPHEAFVIEIGRADVHLYIVSRVFDLEARVLPGLDEGVNFAAVLEHGL